LDVSLKGDKKKMKAYIASGWFTEEQDLARLQIIHSCRSVYLDFYSPKDDFLYIPGKTNPQEVFEENIKQIISSDFVIASTVGKDMGTIFECGFTYSLDIPLIYYWPGGKGPFNLMLSQTAKQVCTSFELLKLSLQNVIKDKCVRYIEYKGEIE
jgi:nucleoside 2-deoxyribosyltransferase